MLSGLTAVLDINPRASSWITIKWTVGVAMPKYWRVGLRRRLVLDWRKQYMRKDGKYLSHIQNRKWNSTGQNPCGRVLGQNGHDQQLCKSNFSTIYATWLYFVLLNSPNLLIASFWEITIDIPQLNNLPLGLYAVETQIEVLLDILITQSFTYEYDKHSGRYLDNRIMMRVFE